MRQFALAALAVVLFAPTSASAQQLPGEPFAHYHTGASSDALRVWEMATLEQRLHQRVEHPMRIRKLRNEITITEVRVHQLRWRLRQYRPFTGFRQGGALNLTIEETRMALLREELHLRELRTLLSEEQRYYVNHQRLLVLEAERAAIEAAKEASFARNNPNARIEIVTHESPADEIGG